MKQAPKPSWGDAARHIFFRIAASGVVPAKYFRGGNNLEEISLAARHGRIELEIVTHCWQYDHLLAYQLSSLVQHPPRNASVRMTVYYSPEDEATAAVLAFFGAMETAGVSWDWRPLPKERLFRRAIGRNDAALSTRADWIWFTDCDVIFGEGCIDGLAGLLQGNTERLVFPRTESVTPLLPPDDPMFSRGSQADRLVSPDISRFAPRELRVAKGPMQITHGDVARAVGYCEAISLYQKPAPRWQKAWEDRAFRWLLETDGKPLDVPAVFRIRHASKGRYENRLMAFIRGGVRRSADALGWRRGVR